MKITNHFPMAVHILLSLAVLTDHKQTSDFIAGSVKTNPVIIRKILGQLQSAKLIRTQAGAGGSTLLQKPRDISLLDIYAAVNPAQSASLFNFHKRPNQKCPVGQQIHAVLDEHLQGAQQSLENYLKNVSLADLVKKL
jgi:Rrf2 family protein